MTILYNDDYLARSVIVQPNKCERRTFHLAQVNDWVAKHEAPQMLSWGSPQSPGPEFPGRRTPSIWTDLWRPLAGRYQNP